ncbi:hypothetical protein Tco_1555808 [Tanacetum coccineum]
MNQSNQRRDFSKSYSSIRRPFAKSIAQMATSNAVNRKWGSGYRPSIASYNWRNSRPNFNYNKHSTKEHRKIECIYDSGDRSGRAHDSFDMKTPSPAKGFACLIAKATSDESKLWHRRGGEGGRFGGVAVNFLENNPMSTVLENQANLHWQNPEEKDACKDIFHKYKKEEDLMTEPKKRSKDSSTDSLEDNPKIQAFRRELEEIALKHLGTPKTRIFDEASYDEEGVITGLQQSSSYRDIKFRKQRVEQAQELHALAFSVIFKKTGHIETINKRSKAALFCLTTFYLRRKPKERLLKL